jgi:hypothetical protein
VQQKHGEKPNQAVKSLNQGVKGPLNQVIFIAKFTNVSEKGSIQKIDINYDELFLVPD